MEVKSLFWYESVNIANYWPLQHSYLMMWSLKTSLRILRGTNYYSHDYLFCTQNFCCTMLILSAWLSFFLSNLPCMFFLSCMIYFSNWKWNINFFVIWKLNILILDSPFDSIQISEYLNVWKHYSRLWTFLDHLAIYTMLCWFLF